MYNGYANWETWAAYLWIDNEVSNYEIKLNYFKRCIKNKTAPTFTGLVNYAIGFGGLCNTDISYSNSRIKRKELTTLLQDEYTQYILGV